MVQKKRPSRSRVVRKLDEKRQSAERKKKIAKRRAAGITEHWYELVEYFDPANIKTVTLDEVQGYRTFLHGFVEDMAIVEVSHNLPEDQIKMLGVRLGEMGVKALIVSDNVKFMKLRPCSVEECELLDEADTEKKGQLFTRAGGGTRSESDSIGNSSRWPRLAADLTASDQDGSEDTDAGETPEDPGRDPLDSDG